MESYGIAVSGFTHFEKQRGCGLGSDALWAVERLERVSQEVTWRLEVGGWRLEVGGREGENKHLGFIHRMV